MPSGYIEMNIKRTGHVHEMDTMEMDIHAFIYYKTTVI